MGQDSKIEWTTHTFNPWRGCTKVSAGCANCYAEKLSYRNPGVLGIWGDNGTRVIASESAWKEPLKWDRAAKMAGERHRVFCASLADVFEDRPELVAPRVRLFHLISETPNLDWLLLTKRPENIHRFYGGQGVSRSWSESMPPNVWLGTSVENQAAAEERIPQLLAAPATVHFLSMEPLLGAVDLTDIGGPGHDHDALTGEYRDASVFRNTGGIDWVIVGGESGSHARPMHPQWVRSIRDQCVQAGVPFHFKQHGEWLAIDDLPLELTRKADTFKSISMLPNGLIDKQIDRAACQANGSLPSLIYRVGKTAGGRMLDDRTWDELPTLSEATSDA